MNTLSIVLSLLLVKLAFSQNANLTMNPANFPGALCNRDCNGAEPRICYFSLLLEYYHAMGPACGDCGRGSNSDCFRNQCITADGSPKSLMSINRQLPAPPLRVCQNDLLVVDVTNGMGGTSTTLHWHGLHQRNTPFYDGVPFINQCPIDFANTFRYTMWASEAGTQWYHSHTGHHKSNGLYGSLIIGRPDASEPNRDYYDEDLQEHVIIVSDSMQLMSEMYEPGLRQDPMGINPDNLLINGKGMRRRNVTRSGLPTVKAPIEVFKVQKGKRYRFRLINAVSHACPVSIEFQGHNLTVLASDSFDLRPETVDRVISNSGERYDFVVDASQCGGNFWIRVTGLGVCDLINPLEQYALLTYDETTPIRDISLNYDRVPSRTEQLNSQQRTLNHPLTICGPGDQINLCVTDMESYDLGRGIVDVEPDQTIHLGFKQNPIDGSESSYFFQGNNFERFMANREPGMTVGSTNGIALQFPSISLQTQFDELESSGTVFCSEGNIPASCRGTSRPYCNCIHVIKIPLGNIVELMIVDETLNNVMVPHPFHLHGVQFYVTEIGQNFNESMTVARAEEIRSRRAFEPRSPRGFFPIKDTVSVPAKGFSVQRFRADNPGFWIVHCHYEWHAATGMATIFQIGETHEMTPPPADFPKCGNYKNNYDMGSILRPQWIQMDAKSALPRNCHLGGFEKIGTAGNLTYIGRRAFGSEVTIGRVRFDLKRLYVLRDGRETFFTDYEIFCGGRITWAPRETDVSMLVPAGRDINGQSTYVCQAKHLDNVSGLEHTFTGFYTPATRLCTTVIRAQVKTQTEFTLMRIL